MDINKYNFAELDKKIRDSFQSDYGPGDMPLDYRTKSCKTVIVPFGGLEEVGPCAAWGYHELAESEFADTYVFVSSNPVNNRNVVFSENVKTPFGMVKGDSGLATLLLSNLEFLDRGQKVENVDPFMFHLPFLQLASKDKLRDINALYLLLGDADHENIIKISELLSEAGKNIVVICSSNFVQFGQEFGYMPFKFNVKSELENLNNGIYEHILNMNPARLIDFVELKGLKLNIKPVILGLEFSKCMGVKKGKLLRKYSTSDLNNDYSKSVNYACFVF